MFIPAEMLKSTTDIHVSLLTNIINSSIRNGYFPDELKAAEVAPIFKKNDDLDKENYRPVSVLPHILPLLSNRYYCVIWCISGEKSLFVRNKSTSGKPV